MDAIYQGLTPAAFRPLRREIQIVFQDPWTSLSPRMTAGQIVGEGLALHEPRLSPQERTRRVAEALAACDLSPDAIPNLLDRVAAFLFGRTKTKDCYRPCLGFESEGFDIR